MASSIFHIGITFIALHLALVLTQEPVRVSPCCVINFDFNQANAGVGNVQEVPVAEKPKPQPPVVVHTVKRLPRPHPVPVATPPINKKITTMPVEISPVPSAPAPLIDIPLPVFNNDPPPLAEVHIGRAAAPETEVEGHHPLYWKLSGGVELVPVVPAPSHEPVPIGCGGEHPTNCPGINWSTYMSELQHRIKKFWFPPRHCFDPYPRVTVQFKIDRDGKMHDLKMLKPGLHARDEAAGLDAVKNASEGRGFKPLPAGAPESVDIEFTFDYHLFGTGKTPAVLR